MIEVSAAGFTVSDVEPLMELKLAAIAVTPCALALAKPEVLIDAAAEFEEAHVALLVRSPDEPSL